jgi:uncharacterized protein YfiM (DUF2279 family)
MRALRRLLGWALLLALVMLALAAAGLWLALETSPQVPRTAQASLLDLARAMRLAQVIDPRQQGGEGPREVSLSQRDLELLIDQGAQRTAVPVAGRVTLQARQARLQASLDLTELMRRNPALSTSASAWRPVFQSLFQDRWLNVDLGLQETEALPGIARLRIGRLPLPGWVGEWLLRSQLEQHLGPEQQRMARDMVKTVRFAPDRLQLGYVWRPGSLKRMMAVLVPKPDQDRLRIYVERLAALKLKSVAGGRIPMGQLLQPALALAQQRTAAGGDAGLENRSAIVAVAFASFPRELVTVLPAARRWRLPKPWRLVLAGREDFPLHYLISAALAAEAGGPFADAVGVFKEVLDARGKSGFSFNDLAADRAGARLGLLARQRPATLQTRVAAGLGDADFLPDVRDVPESLTAADFNARYGAIGSPAYQRLLADIESRIDALPLYR